MKILVTGCTSLQVGNERRVGISKIDVPAAVVDALRSLGHEVDWKKVTPGDDLSDYDAAWVNMAPINSLNGRAGAMGALWTLSSGLPCVAFQDDWQIHAVFNGTKAVVRRPEMLTKYMLTGTEHRGDEQATHWSYASAKAARDRILERDPKAKPGIERYYMRDTDENVLPHAERLVRAAQEYNVTRFEQGMVMACPMYAWGDKNLINKRLPAAAVPFEVLDPSPVIYDMIADHEPMPAGSKKFGWVLGALMPHDAWVERRTWEWPITYTGARLMVRRHGGQRLKTEDDVLDLYNRHWGILSPPYPHAGSGWWRSRFMYAARVKSVLCCDRGEGDPLGPAYKWGHEDIEKLDADSLLNLAEEQAAALRPWMPSRQAFVDTCERIVNRAVREDRGGLQS